MPWKGPYISSACTLGPPMRTLCPSRTLQITCFALFIRLLVYFIYQSPCVFVTLRPPFLHRSLNCQPLPAACWWSECVSTRSCFSYSLGELSFEAIGRCNSRMHPPILCVLHEYPASQWLMVDCRDARLGVAVGFVCHTQGVIDVLLGLNRSERDPAGCRCRSRN